MKIWTLLWIVVLPFSVASCMDQYNPRPYWKQFNEERIKTSKQSAQLTDKGELPPIEEKAVDQDPVMAKYTSLCSSCHGADGRADGPAAVAMNPKPRNLHDKAWQAKVSDDHIATVIKSGGTAVGLSGTMPPWGAVLSPEEVTGLVAKIREWGK